MNGLLGSTELLEQSGNLNNDQRELLSIVRSSAEAMLTIISDVLDLSKIESGKISLSISRFPIRECMENAMSVVASMAHSKGLEIQYCAKLDVPYFIDGDSARLTQIFFNLLSNAVKFSSAGEVTLTVDVEEGDLLTARNQLDALDQSKSRPYKLHFCVRDQGIGVPKRSQHLLFKPFSQIESSESARNVRNGTGLGLTISSHLVELMGGKIWLESEAGAGSAFHFTIACTGSDNSRPLWLNHHVTALDDPSGPCVALSSEVRSKCVFLLIDEYETTRNWMAEAADNWGFTMLTARNIPEAKSILSDGNVSDLCAVIADYRSVCTMKQRDLDTSEVLVESSTSDQTSRALERAEVAAAHESLHMGPDQIRLNYSVDRDRLSLLVEATRTYQNNRFLHSDEYVPPLPIIGMGPVSLRSLLAGEGRCSGYISAPVKTSALYEALRDAAQRMVAHVSKEHSEDQSIDRNDRIYQSSPSPTLDFHLPSQTASGSVSRNSSSSSSPRSVSSSSNSSNNSEGSSPDPSRLDLVFVVDDNPINRKVLRRMLTRFGYADDQLAAAENGQVAVTYLHKWLAEHSHLERSPRVCIILDKTMPVLDGIQCAKFIRASTTIHPHHQPFIVALTANAMTTDRELCLEAGMDEYLPKPVTLDALANMLKKANSKWD